MGVGSSALVPLLRGLGEGTPQLQIAQMPSGMTLGPVAGDQPSGPSP